MGKMTTSVRFYAWDFYNRDEEARISPFQFDVTAPVGQAITLVTPTAVEVAKRLAPPEVPVPAPSLVPAKSEITL